MSIHSAEGCTMQDSGESQPNDHREEKRRRILRAAIDEFARKGYFSARMADVARTAAVADGTLYLYFEGKEHLLVSVFDDVLSRAIERARAEISGVGSPLEKLKIVVRLHLETLAGDRALAHVIQIETRHSRRFMNVITRGRLGEYFDLLRSLIAEGQEAGEIRRDVSPGFATNIVFGAVDEIVNSWLLADDPGDLTRFHAPLMDLLSAGMAEHRG
jgi:TetR/AcrR family fatty acid metabolism transcriptional regulator